LEEVVEHYDRGGDDQSNLSKDIRPLKLSRGDKDDLVSFMRALNGRPTAVTIPALPQSPIVSIPAAPLRTATSGK
jgi:cytochrome c peroxidase